MRACQQRLSPLLDNQTPPFESHPALPATSWTLQMLVLLLKLLCIEKATKFRWFRYKKVFSNIFLSQKMLRPAIRHGVVGRTIHETLVKPTQVWTHEPSRRKKARQAKYKPTERIRDNEFFLFAGDEVKTTRGALYIGLKRSPRCFF